MKKFGILMALAMIASPALADFWTNCTNNGGTIIQANSYGNDKGGLCNDPSDSTKTNNCNGKKFCKSENKTNWWSAFTWCESIGGQLTTFELACPGTQQILNNIQGACPNLTNAHTCKDSNLCWCWTKLGWGNNAVLEVNVAKGNVYNHWERHSGQYVALCVE